MSREQAKGKRFRGDAHLYCRDCGKRTRAGSTSCPKCHSGNLSVKPVRSMAPKARAEK